MRIQPPDPAVFDVMFAVGYPWPDACFEVESDE